MPEIDDIIYSKGLEAIQGLNKAGYSVPKVSFNVGAKQLESPKLRNIHKEFDLGSTKIAFEILESVLVEEQGVAFSFHIDLLREAGFRIEIDDFGSGHASIVGLMQLRPDNMKLDQRLIMPLTRDPKAIVTVDALVKIGQSQGIKITAEGVENGRARKDTGGVRCRYPPRPPLFKALAAQGYWIVPGQHTERSGRGRVIKSQSSRPFQREAPSLAIE